MSITSYDFFMYCQIIMIFLFTFISFIWYYIYFISFNLLGYFLLSSMFCVDSQFVLCSFVLIFCMFFHIFCFRCFYEKIKVFSSLSTSMLFSIFSIFHVYCDFSYTFLNHIYYLSDFKNLDLHALL